MFPQNQNGQSFNVAPTPNAPKFNAAPGLGNVAANMNPGSPNIPNPNSPNIMPTAPESAPIQSQEKLSNHETQIGPGQDQTQTQQDDQAAAVVVQQVTPIVPVATTTQTTTTPATAADDDLIEKEWVDQARTIVARTKDDPHEQARLAAELMRDYIKKRYGKSVGKAQDD
ncbi:hypothetical protein FWF74_01965 [Candidatus Saccharibacteria bacterium]|nr:hypothetical protein [Candidatus Saccharibacteria bacterium]MCL1963425.1 hypothetical protein [Candidatus Saccharibacteria bacterium]